MSNASEHLLPTPLMRLAGVDPLCPHRRIAGLSGRNAEVDRVRPRPAEGVHFGAPPATRAAEGLVAFFF